MAATLRLDTIQSTTGTSAITITPAGIIGMPAQPAFSAYGNGAQAFSGTTAFQILQLNIQNTLGTRTTGYNTSTYTFTAPVAGAYLFLGKITQQGTTAAGPSGWFFVNGATSSHEAMICYYTGYMSSSGFQIIQLAAGDAVTFRVSNYNNSTFTIDTTRSGFAGYLLG
jgi:hypothetical protein